MREGGLLDRKGMESTKINKIKFFDLLTYMTLKFAMDVTVSAKGRRKRHIYKSYIK